MRAILCAAATTAALCFSTMAQAQDATLTARDGALAVSGRLISFDGLVYRIDTQWGRLSVNAAAVDCDGPGCPDLTRFAPELRIAAEPWLADRVLLPLVHSFARSEGLTLTETPDLLELSRGDRPELRLRLLPLGGPAAPVLEAEAADAALSAEGRIVARLPLALTTAADAPPGLLSLSALRAQRQQGGGWEALGRELRPLVWHSTPPGSALDRSAETALGPVSGEMRRAATPEAVAAALGHDPWGAAILPLPLAAGLIARDLQQDCGLVLDLSPFAAAAGDHALLLPVGWMESGRPLPPAARAFADHLVSPAAQTALGAAGMPAPSAQWRRPLSDQGIRLANALRDSNPELTRANLQTALALLDGAARLALTFRFDERSGALDSASAQALRSLSDSLAAGSTQGHEVLLIGFTDSTGPAERNLTAARIRAEAVLTALEAITPDLPPGTRLRAEALGEAFPLACDDSQTGRQLNRRVEVWLRPQP